MKRRSPLIGFTEAELGFVVAAVVALAAISAPASGTGEADVTIEVDSAAADSARADSMGIGIGGAVVTGDSGSGGPRSDSLSNVVVKRCHELGLPRSPIPAIDVLGSEWFAIGADSGGFDMLDRVLAPHEVIARNRPCRFFLYFRSHDSTTSRRFIAITQRFSGRFITVPVED